MAHSAHKIAVRGRNRALARAQNAHVPAQARPARRCGHDCSRLQKDLDQPLLQRLQIDAVGGRNDDALDARPDPAALQDPCRRAQVGQPAVGAASDDRLMDLDRVKRADLARVGGKVRESNRGLQPGEVDFNGALVGRVGIGQDGLECAVGLVFQIFARCAVHREDSVLCARLNRHVRHRKAVVHGHGLPDRFIALIDKYENFDKLTIAMLNEFIEKILVHERDRKGSIQTTQEVEIYFNFVGRFVPPAFGEVELTPEELEEIRKREERKDRLHQNYLKRKASGAQKRYEDKIKGRKKAEIEAKKAAIRAEDIAKGVFVPASSLPQREPMKGVQTA